MIKLSAAYRAAYSMLNDDQRRAVDKIDGPVLIIAGPGTGKTQLLTTRIGRILEVTDSAPENILCLTFSDSAAATMQERLSSLIGPLAYDVTISTYHSFGSQLIQTYPDLFNLSQAIQPVDDLTLDQLLRKVIDSLEYTNPLKADLFINSIKTLISGYKRALITPDTLEQVCRANLDFINQASNIVNNYLHPGERISKAQLKLYKHILNDSRKLQPAIELSPITQLATLFNDELAAAIDEAESNAKMTALSKWKAIWLENNQTGLYRISSERTNNRQLAMAQIYRHYNELLASNNLYDYDDMILNAINGLIANPDIKLTLQERYQYILLDEFQDTNEAQLKLVELLVDNPINEGRPNILAVGDDDQAIYSFQGAHYSHMRRFYSTYRSVELISLRINYRSTPGIVGLSSNIRRQISESLDLVVKHQLSQASINNEQIIRVELPLDLKQLSWVASYVNNLIANGHQAEDIAILAPKHRLLVDLIPYLHTFDIPLSYEQKDNILDDELIVQLINCARLVLALSKMDEADADCLWPIVLSGAYWQLPVSLLWQLSWRVKDNRTNWTESILSQPKTRPIGLFFIRLSQLTTSTSFEEMLNYLSGNMPLDINEPGLKQYTSPFLHQYVSKLELQDKTLPATAWRLLGHLSILRSRVKAANENGVSLEGLIEFIDAYKQAKLKIVDTSPFIEQSSAVRLMTAYSAKGQEFKTVILIDLVDEQWGSSSRGQSAKIALPQNLRHVRIDRSNDDDKLRLLFVALSRARERLVLASYTNDVSGNSVAQLRYFDERYTDNKLQSPLLPEGSIIEQPDSALISDLASSTNWFNLHLDRFDPDRQALLKNRLDLFKLSATKLNAYSYIGKGGPIQFYLDYILQFPSATTLSSHFGVCIHEALDWQFKQTINSGHIAAIDDVIKEFENQFKKRLMSNNDYEHYLNRGIRCLRSYFEQTDIVNRADDLSEEQFDVSYNGMRLVGNIDRLIIDKAARSIKIIDFKTGKSYAKWNHDIKSFHHARQMYFYKLLVENDRRFKNYQVTSAAIQFVEPDVDDNSIKSLSLSFEQAECAKLNNYLTVVWDNIMRLDFPDCSGYTDTLKGIRNFEADIIKNSKTALTAN